MLRSIVLLAFLTACGGTAPEWAGNWQTTPSPSLPGAYTAMTLSGSGTHITGSGTIYREAGTPTTFTVAGTSDPVPGFGVTFTYADNSTEGFTFDQIDPDHLSLASLQRTLDFHRVQ